MRRGDLSPALARFAPVVVVVLFAFLVSLHTWTKPVRWADPDSLYYQAKALSYRGADEHDALHAAFRSPIADEILANEREAIAEDPGRRRQFTDAGWIDYSSRFYRRRIFVSLAAAGIYPLAGERSVLDVSLIGYLFLAALLYALLRRRFGTVLSVAVTCACLVAPPLRSASFIPMTDSWGLALEVCALLAATLVFDRGLRWLGLWVVALALLSITRDDSVVALVAVACLGLQLRERRSAWLLGSGVLAVIPAILAFGNSSVRENLAFVFNGYNPPTDTSNSFILDHYPGSIGHLVGSDLTYGLHLGAQTPIWFLGLVVAAFGLVLLVPRAAGGKDAFFSLMAFSLLGGVVFVALFADYSGLRQELVFVPAIAVALALAGEYAFDRYAERSRTPDILPTSARPQH